MSDEKRSETPQSPGYAPLCDECGWAHHPGEHPPRDRWRTWEQRAREAEKVIVSMGAELRVLRAGAGRAGTSRTSDGTNGGNRDEEKEDQAVSLPGHPEPGMSSSRVPDPDSVTPPSQAVVSRGGDPLPACDCTGALPGTHRASCAIWRGVASDATNRYEGLQARIAKFDRYDSDDESTIFCSCGAIFIWTGADERLWPWLDEHEPHVKPRTETPQETVDRLVEENMPARGARRTIPMSTGESWLELRAALEGALIFCDRVGRQDHRADCESYNACHDAECDCPEEDDGEAIMVTHETGTCTCLVYDAMAKAKDIRVVLERTMPRRPTARDPQAGVLFCSQCAALFDMPTQAPKTPTEGCVECRLRVDLASKAKSEREQMSSNATLYEALDALVVATKAYDTAPLDARTRAIKLLHGGAERDG